MKLLQTSGKYKDKIRRNFSDVEFEEIKLFTPWIKDISRKSIRERVYCILNKITEYPKCLVCGEDNHFLTKKYSNYCSNSCGVKSKITQAKIRQTKLKKYNDETYNNPNKAKQTSLKKYNVEHTSQLTSNRLTAKNTNLFNNGSLNYNNRLKSKETCLKKYGTDNPSKSKEIKDKISIIRSNNFQKRKINDDYIGIVYIIHFKELSLVKIGVSSNFKSRTKQLIKDFGNFSIIKLIETTHCFKLERELHEKFKTYRVCLTEGIGRTEFFDDKCLHCNKIII